jgi:hypothetical protein
MKNVFLRYKNRKNGRIITKTFQVRQEKPDFVSWKEKIISQNCPLISPDEFLHPTTGFAYP